MGACTSRPNEVSESSIIPCKELMPMSLENSKTFNKSNNLPIDIDTFINDEQVSIGEKEQYLIIKCSLYLRRHAQAVTSISLSPDGKSAISSSKDSTVRIWDLKTSRQTGEIPVSSEVNQACISPDNKFIFSLSNNRDVSQWEIPSLNLVTVFKDFDYRIGSIAVSPDSKQILIAGGFIVGDNTCPIHVFDIKSKKELKGFYGHRAAANSMVFTEDKKFMVTCAGGQYVAVEDNSVRLWNMKSHENIAVYTKFTDFVNCVAVASKRKIIIAGCHDRSIHMLDFELKKIEVFRGHESSVNALAIAPGEKFMISGGLDATVRIWDIEKQWQVYQLNTTSIYSIAVNLNSVFIGSMCNIKILDLASHNHTDMQGHNGKIEFIQMKPMSRHLLTASGKGLGSDATVRIWNLSTQLQENVISFPNGVVGMEITRDGKGVLFEFDTGDKKGFSVRGDKKWVNHSKAFDFILLSRHRLKLR